MTPATALVLLGFGVGALVVADRTALRERAPLRADTLREQAVRAQEASARASRRARELMDQWIAAEDDAQKAGQ